MNARVSAELSGVGTGGGEEYGTGGNGGLEGKKSSGVGDFGGCQLSSTRGSGWPLSGPFGVLSRAQSRDRPDS